MNRLRSGQACVAAVFLVGGLTALACDYEKALVQYSDWTTIDQANCVQTRSVTQNSCGADSNENNCSQNSKNVSVKRQGVPDGYDCVGPWKSITGTLVNDTVACPKPG